MANELALGLVIGGAVNKSVGAAFKDVEGRVKRLETTMGKAKALQSVIGETKRLQDEWRKAHLAGSTMADGLRRKLDANLDTLRRQGVEVRNLGKAYEQAGRKARAAELKATGHAQMKEGGVGLRNTAVATAGAAAATMIMPTKISAEYGAIIRDIALKAGIANKPEEAQMSKTIVDTSRNTGMKRNDVAEVVNALVGAGMELKQAVQYAPVAAKFVVGQGADGTDTAKMINALGQNAKISDPKDMQKALEAIAFQGQAGSFEAADMAKWFPELLAGMGKLGIYGNDSVTQLGAMLQVQMKTAGSSDEAANNLKNWMEKIGSTDVVKSYKDAGIDYQASLNTGLQKGMSTLESSFALAQRYVQATDPKKAAAMSEAVAKISKEADPAKAKEMMTALEQAMRTGDLFSDMQVKAALTAYMQNKQLYEQLKTDSANATGILDKNLAERREASAQMWSETGQAMDDAMRSAGEAIRPLTDALANGLTSVAKQVATIADKSPALVTGLLGAGAAISAISAAYSGFKVVKGLMNLGRGSLMGNPNLVQKVAVVSGLGGAGGAGVPDLGDAGAGGKDKAKAGAKGKRWWQRGSATAAASTAATPATGAASSVKPRLRVYAGGGPAEAPRSLSSWKPPTTTPGAAVTPIAPAVPATSAFSRLKGLGKNGLPAKLFEAAISAKDVYDNAETKDEKAEGYGSVAGSLAGTMAGAAAGAAIGSVVPIIGTAIGGLIGAYLGSMGGSAVGGVVGKSLFGGPDKPVVDQSSPVTPLLMTARPGPAVPSLASMGSSFAAPGAPLVMRNGGSGGLPGFNDVANSFKEPGAQQAGVRLSESFKAGPAAAAPAAPKIEQTNTFSPQFHITVQGDAKDPQQLANQMMPEIERHLASLAQQTARRDMSDVPVF